MQKWDRRMRWTDTHAKQNYICTGISFIMLIRFPLGRGHWPKGVLKDRLHKRWAGPPGRVIGPQSGHLLILSVGWLRACVREFVSVPFPPLTLHVCPQLVRSTYSTVMRVGRSIPLWVKHDTLLHSAPHGTILLRPSLPLIGFAFQLTSGERECNFNLLLGLSPVPPIEF